MPRAKTTIVYKVVVQRGEGEPLISYNYRTDHEDAPDCVHYTSGEWTEAEVRGTPIFAFASLQPAWLTAWGPRQQIWRCEAVGVRFFHQSIKRVNICGACHSVHVEHTGTLTPATLKKFWRGWKTKPWPKTPDFNQYVLCEKIKLLEQV